MFELIHHNVQILEKLLDDFNRVQKLYSEKSFSFEEELNNFLEELLNYFKEKGKQSKESEVLNLKNMLSLAKRGVNPVSMEKLKTGRRDLYWSFGFRALDELNTILQEIYHLEIEKIEEGEDILNSLILSLIQNNIINDNKISELNSYNAVQVFWDDLISTQNGSISLINNKLRMKLIKEDIYLILEKLFNRLQN